MFDIEIIIPIVYAVKYIKNQFNSIRYNIIEKQHYHLYNTFFLQHNSCYK
jgi:hypothetical protein